MRTEKYDMNLSSICMMSGPLMLAVIETLEHEIHAPDVLLEKYQATFAHHVAPEVQA